MFVEARGSSGRGATASRKHSIKTKERLAFISTIASFEIDSRLVTATVVLSRYFLLACLVLIVAPNQLDTTAASSPSSHTTLQASVGP